MATPNLLLPHTPSKPLLSALYLLVDSLWTFGSPQSQPNHTSLLLDAFGRELVVLPDWKTRSGKGRLQALYDVLFVKLIVCPEHSEGTAPWNTLIEEMAHSVSDIQYSRIFVNLPSMPSLTFALSLSHSGSRGRCLATLRSCRSIERTSHERNSSPTNYASPASPSHPDDARSLDGNIQRTLSSVQSPVHAPSRLARRLAPLIIVTDRSSDPSDFDS